jgi:hypothetical protein
MCILKRARVILLIWLFFYAINSQSQSYRFVISEALGEVQTNLILGKLPAATKLIQQEKKAHPENLAWLYLENHLEFLEILMYQDPEIISDREKNETSSLKHWRKYRRLRPITYLPKHNTTCNGPLFIPSMSVI